MNINYRTVAPEGTFIREYMDAMQGLETAHAYDFWCACWLIGNVVGRNVYIDRPRIPVRFNWYLLLAAESGVTRKSTAVNIARKVLSPLMDETETLIESKTTPERLEYLLGYASEKHDCATAAIAISELVTFLGRERYTMQMPAVLTDLYDCPDDRSAGGVLGRRSYSLRNVFVSFLSASTPSWLVRAVNPDVIEGGFTSRCIFIVEERRKRRVAWPAVGDSDDRAVLHESLGTLREEARAVGAIPLTPAAIKRFSRWYDRRIESRDPFRVSFEAREDEHVLRMAGTLAINERLYKVEARHVQHAIKLINRVKHDAAALFVGGVTPDRILVGIDTLRTILIEAGHDGVQQNKLFHRVRRYLSNEDFRTVLELMHTHDMVQRFELALSDSAVKKARIWRATRHISEKGRLDSVLTNMKP